jgi:hypothetical protein
MCCLPEYDGNLYLRNVGRTSIRLKGVTSYKTLTDINVLPLEEDVEKDL